MGEFIDNLRQEKLDTQQRRYGFIKLKLMLIAGLLGVGSWEFAGNADNYLLLYLVPFVGFALDLYIHGENFAVRRIGHFAKNVDRYDPTERAWEKFVDQHRDQFTRMGIICVSLLVFLGTWVILHYKHNNIIVKSYIYWHYGWIGINVCILIFFTRLSESGYRSLANASIPKLRFPVHRRISTAALGRLRKKKPK